MEQKKQIEAMSTHPSPFAPISTDSSSSPSSSPSSVTVDDHYGWVEMTGISVDVNGDIKCRPSSFSSLASHPPPASHSSTASRSPPTNQLRFQHPCSQHMVQPCIIQRNDIQSNHNPSINPALHQGETPRLILPSQHPIPTHRYEHEHERGREENYNHSFNYRNSAGKYGHASDLNPRSPTTRATSAPVSKKKATTYEQWCDEEEESNGREREGDYTFTPPAFTSCNISPLSISSRSGDAPPTLGTSASQLDWHLHSYIHPDPHPYTLPYPLPQPPRFNQQHEHGPEGEEGPSSNKNERNDPTPRWSIDCDTFQVPRTSTEVLTYKKLAELFPDLEDDCLKSFLCAREDNHVLRSDAEVEDGSRFGIEDVGQMYEREGILNRDMNVDADIESEGTIYEDEDGAEGEVEDEVETDKQRQEKQDKSRMKQHFTIGTGKNNNHTSPA